ncbi:MAG: tyrosine-type recombinase/integrase [Chloroflexi bacterium]|nr:tyrosine-type recombinase/integrase [Chloroflexota bacterium]
MRGHIIKRYKNSYTVVLNLGIDPITRKRKQQWISVKGTKKDAEKRLAEILHQLDNGTFMKPGKTTLAEYLTRWLREYAQPNLSPRTVEGYESIIRQHLVPNLGNIPLTQIKPEHLQRYYSEMLSGGRCDGRGNLNPVTVRQHHMVLHRSLHIAVKWGLISRNPADAIDLPHCQRPEMHVMNEDNIQTFLEAAKSTPYYTLFYMALFTGMRRSELLALRWCDVDLILGQISVNRSLHHLRDKSLVFRTPKTAKGRRTIALPPSAILVLKEHKKQQGQIRLMLGTLLVDDDLVLSQSDGRPLLPDTVSHAWAKLAQRTGLKGIRLHDARHSHASLMLKQGIHPKIVQERLGHASIQVTLDTYSHVAPGLQEAAAIRFDEAFISTPKKELVAKLG